MKVGIITEICNSKSGARAPIELAICLAKQNEVSLYATDSQLEPQTLNQLQNKEIMVHLIKEKKIPILKNLYKFISLLNLLKVQKLDILAVNSQLAFYLSARFSHAPLVYTYHGIQFNVLKEKIFNNKVKYALLYPLDLLFNLLIYLKMSVPVLTADRTITISKFTAEEVSRLYKKQVEHIYWGALPSSTKIKTTTATKKTNKTTILSVSRITPYKNFHTLIKIFRSLNSKHPQTRLLLVGSLGESNYLNYLKSIANESIAFRINIYDKELFQIYQSCDIYATLDNYLFFGMPILEAASYGKPILALNRCSAKEIVNDQLKNLVADDLNEFTRLLESLIQNEKMRLKYGSLAQQNALKHFSWRRCAKQYQDVFRRIYDE